MKKYTQYIGKFSLTLSIVLLIANNSINVSADDACSTTNTTGSIYGNIIDTCQTSVTEGDLILIAMVIFTVGVAALVSSKFFNRFTIN